MRSGIPEHKVCCPSMGSQVEFKCGQHSDPFDCPDNLIFYTEKFDEYGIIVHDGGASTILINFCPWCGKNLPQSKRDLWFDKLESMGFDDPLGDNSIPEEFKTGEWYRKIR